MKIIFLNIWNGKQKEELREFILEHRDTTDIFCFQESHQPGYENMKKALLSDFESTRASRKRPEDAPEIGWVNETLYRKNLTLTTTKIFFEQEYEAGLGLVTHFEVDGQTLVLGNIHGVPQPGHKLDTEIRLYQSETIIEYFNTVEGNKIIGGDFNLMPETQSIGMFESAGYQNLIREYSIDTTRNEISWSLYQNKQLYADFVFVGPSLSVSHFEVPKNTASDHLPMVLEVAISQ